MLKVLLVSCYLHGLSEEKVAWVSDSVSQHYSQIVGLRYRALLDKPTQAYYLMSGFAHCLLNGAFIKNPIFHQRA